MPSILDLVTEYCQLERQKTDQEGVLDEAAEMRYQCLKFFLEFDLIPPYFYAQMGQGMPQAIDVGGPGAEGEPPGVEVTGAGPQDFEVVEEASLDAAASGPDGVGAGAAESGNPIDIPEEDLNRTVDDLFSAQLGIGAGVEAAIPEIALPATASAPPPPLPAPEMSAMASWDMAVPDVPAPAQAAPVPEPQPEPQPEPEPQVEPQREPEPQATAKPAFAITEAHRVTVHFLDGDVKRGVVRELGSEADDLCLFSMDEQSFENFPVVALKAVFLILQPGTKPSEAPPGKEISVTFKDGRTLKGRSPDFTPIRKIFTLYPEPRQGNVERVVVFKEATDEIW